jgi:AcrR family transcriptional regulator
MQVPRQESAAETEGGRVNQKRRTRTAIVDAALRLLDRGIDPTVAEAAEEAMVSRTTAYRYFPTQEALLLELSISVDVSEVEALLATPVDRDGVEERVRELFESFNRHVLAEETRYRSVLRLYLDQTLSAARVDGDPPIVREGRRTRWITETLAPLRGTLPDETLHRLENALCLVMGIEAMVVLRDVCQLDPDEAVAVTQWAAQALLRGALSD